MTNPLPPAPVVSRVAEESPIPAAWAAESFEDPRPAPQLAAPVETQAFEGVADLGRAPIVRMKGDARRGIPEHDACSSCGARMEAGAEGHVAAARVVKAGNRYGDCGAGSLVWIEVGDLRDAALAATMGLQEYRAEISRHAAPRAPTEKPLLVRMVEAGMEAAARQTRELIDRGRDRLRRETERAAAEAHDLRRQQTAIDQEGSVQPTRPVEGSEL
jgi:hypothetical protein